jgi:hypothetical protein
MAQCPSFSKGDDEQMSENRRQAKEEQLDLRGCTKQEIRQAFGEPEDVSSSFFLDTKSESWSYDINTDQEGDVSFITVTFEGDEVNGVFYD